jgi:hypothetical protein
MFARHRGLTPAASVAYRVSSERELSSVPRIGNLARVRLAGGLTIDHDTPPDGILK